MLGRANRIFLFYRTELTRKLSTIITPAEIPNRTHSPKKPSRTSPSEAASALYHRLSALDKGKNGSVDQVLNELTDSEGKSITPTDILRAADHFCRFNKFDHARKLLEWSEKRNKKCLKVREHARCIKLIYKTRGVEAAEKYFIDLPEYAKHVSTYGALLNCFCCEKMTEKSMVLYEKMRELNFPLNSFAYCSLMTLHIKSGQPEKVALLMEEMKQEGIKTHLNNYNLLINSYASLNDIEAVERVEEEIKKEDGVTPNWSFYSQLAGIYIAAGHLEKAELTLKELEKLTFYDPRAFQFLLGHYAKLGKAEEVNRVFQSIKLVFPKVKNLLYLSMLQAHSKLEDIDGLKRCFEEWESSCLSYDVRLANVVIKAYIKRDMIEEAKSFLNHVLKKGYEPKFSTYGIIIDYFVKSQQMDLALEFMKLGTPHLKDRESKLYEEAARLILNYDGDGEAVYGAKLHNLVKQADCLDREVRDSLLKDIASKGIEPQAD